MTRLFLPPLVAVLICVGATPASAQPPPAPGGPAAVQPPFSPYLNLLRQGSSPAANYFGLVRPQQQFANSVQSLQQTTTQLGATQAATDQPVVTGTAFGFQTQRNYFQNQFAFSQSQFGTAGMNAARPGASPQGGRPPGAGGQFGQFGQTPTHTTRGGR